MLTKGPGILREQNQKKILSLLRKYKQTSRKDLAKWMGVSKNTVSIIVDQYINAGIIREVGVKDLQKAGRPKILIEMNADAYHAIGMAIHHNGIEYVVTNYYLETLKSGFIEVEGRDITAVCEKIICIAESLINEFTNVLGIGIGVPGIVNSQEGIVYESTNLQWKNVNISDKLKDSIQVSLVIQNNVKMASLCSSVYDEDIDASSFFYIRIGDGIGGAFIIDGSIWNGESFTSGEIGHISVDPNGPLCGCGQKGCLEKMISRKVFYEWQSSLDGISRDARERETEQKLQQYGTLLGVSLISILNLINPGKIVIDSPYNQYGIFQSSVRDYLDQNALRIPSFQTHIYFNKEAFSQTVGAATAVIHQFEG
ncbi:ROK family transcriptional regulator [Bacillus sp. MMSF_3328]|uniref:ROK family transcriptional regulator n=1 Tax=Bacillus sp. MMSF_3328 TaxID=3047080 RepID=UPI00273E5AD3|nr:ROK family transcriptional regulator [Bacillus sp. MMSF_3328]